MNIQSNNPDFSALKAGQKIAWASGDYSAIGVTLQIVGERLAETLDLTAGSIVLDVAAGNGSTTLAFARHFHSVTSTDYVEELLVHGAARAAAEGFDIAFQPADAENLPFADGQFDAAVSTFGVMFAPDQVQAAAEMLRVVRLGGKIGLASWTPGGFIGQFGRTVARHMPPPAGVNPPVLWGVEDWVRSTFGSAAEITCRPRQFTMRFRDPQHLLEVFKTFYGPVCKVYERLTSETASALDADILKLASDHNTVADGSVRIPAEYLEVSIIK